MNIIYNLAGFDLNLLVAFDALMIEGNVSRAAERVGLSQPAMSNALRRLRDIFKDELFLRTGRAMVPTATAIELAQTIGPALGQIRTGLKSGLSFDPASSRRTFILGFPDLASVGLLPQFSRLLRSEAPEVNFQIIDVGAQGGEELVLAGRMDLAVGLSFSTRSEISRETLGDFEHVVILDRNNPRLRDGRLTVADIAELPHICYAPSSETVEIDERLARLGLKRRIAISVPHALSIPRAIVGTDLIAFTEQGVTAVAADFGLAVVPDPLGLARRRVDMIWHRRQDSDPGHRWLRRQVAAQIAIHRRSWSVAQARAQSRDAPATILDPSVVSAGRMGAGEAPARLEA